MGLFPPILKKKCYEMERKVAFLFFTLHFLKLVIKLFIVPLCIGLGAWRCAVIEKDPRFINTLNHLNHNCGNRNTKYSILIKPVY